MRQIIINADDFGMSKEVNDGIKRGIEAGIINSVSLMVNMPYFDDAIRYLKKRPDISVGLHFNITEGQPIEKPIARSTLLREDNNFYSWSSLTLKLMFGKYLLKEINDALKTQYRKLEKTGLPISHIDSHHHIHLYPSIYQLVLNLAQHKNIRFLRSRSFSWRSVTRWMVTAPSLKQVIFYCLCCIDNLLFPRNRLQIVEINSVYDMGWNKNIDIKNFNRVIANSREGITEIICHPAIFSEDGNPKFLKPRYKILSILLNKSLKKTMDVYNIRFYKRNGLNH